MKKSKVMKNTIRHYAKHPFNVFPEMTVEEQDDVKLDIQTYGYDSSYPIILYQGKVLDGWNRQQICEEIGVVPVWEEFLGDDSEAMDFIWRSNKRRNLTSSQWSAIAVEAQPIMAAINEAVKKEKAEKLQGNQNAKKKPMVESIPPSDLPKRERDESKRTKVKVAKTFNTNVKYLDKAAKLSPDMLEQVKKGELTMTDIMRAERTEALKLAEAQKVLQQQAKESQKAQEALKVQAEALKEFQAQTEVTQEAQESIVTLPVVEEDVDVVAVVKTGLSDEEMLELISVARNEIHKLEGTLVQSDNGTEIESIQIAESPIQKIREIQLTLGIKLTELKFESN